jgi:hypothetical protein
MSTSNTVATQIDLSSSEEEHDVSDIIPTNDPRKQTLEMWLGKPKRKAAKPGCTAKSTMTRNRKKTEEMIASHDWEDVRAGHIVALYAYCHKKVYEFEPVELDDGYEYNKAAVAIHHLADKYFKGSYGRMVQFVRWVWNRQWATEQWRKENNHNSDFRMTWKYCFSPKMVGDYMLYMNRNGIR